MSPAAAPVHLAGCSVATSVITGDSVRAHSSLAGPLARSRVCSLAQLAHPLEIVVVSLPGASSPDFTLLAGASARSLACVAAQLAHPSDRPGSTFSGTSSRTPLARSLAGAPSAPLSLALFARTARSAELERGSRPAAACFPDFGPNHSRSLARRPLAPLRSRVSLAQLAHPVQDRPGLYFSGDFAPRTPLTLARGGPSPAPLACVARIRSLTPFRISRRLAGDGRSASRVCSRSCATHQRDRTLPRDAMRRTRILSTIGPASADPETISRVARCRDRRDSV